MERIHLIGSSTTCLVTGPFRFCTSFCLQNRPHHPQCSRRFSVMRTNTLNLALCSDESPYLFGHFLTLTFVLALSHPTEGGDQRSVTKTFEVDLFLGIQTHRKLLKPRIQKLQHFVKALFALEKSPSFLKNRHAKKIKSTCR